MTDNEEPARLGITRGPIWGDEVCDLCGAPAAWMWHLIWSDGVDQDCCYCCAEDSEAAHDRLFMRLREINQELAARHLRRNATEPYAF